MQRRNGREAAPGDIAVPIGYTRSGRALVYNVGCTVGYTISAFQVSAVTCEKRLTLEISELDAKTRRGRGLCLAK